MFWRKKPTFSDRQFGVMEYRQGCWVGAMDVLPMGRLLVSVAGDQARPGDTGLENARHLLRRLQESSSAARDYVAQRDPGALDEANGDLVLERVDVYRDVGRFDLTFGYTHWDDGSVTVHFRGLRPVGLSQGD